MSQLGSAGATIGNNLTAWNRTPGKPGAGQSVFPTNRWPSTKGSTSVTGEVKRDLIEDDTADKLASDSVSNLWPSLYDAQRMKDATCESNSQWSASAFSGPAASNNLLTTSDQAITHPSSSTGWSDASSSIPRAITGQPPQQQLNHSNAPNDTEAPRRFFGSSLWPMCSEPSEVSNDDSSQLSLALSKINVNSTQSTGSCFQPINDMSEPAASSSLLPTGDATTESNYDRANTSLDNAELEALFLTDPDEAMRAVINTTKPWGIRPVDQSTPWDLSDLPPETVASPNPADAARVSGGAHSSNLFDASQPSRRRDIESNVWPSEPPNGTGIWEAHYESLGERTARWQQNMASNNAPPIGGGFSTQQQSIGGRGDPNNAFRNFMRPAMGPLHGTTAAVSKQIVNPSFHGAPSPTGSSRGFPLAGNSGPWPFPGGLGGSDSVIGSKGRWPNNNTNTNSGGNYNRLAPKHQPHVAHLLSNQGGNNGLRWPGSHMPQGWPLNDPRRPNLMPGNWGGPSGDQPQNFYPPLPSRMCQPGNDFAPPLFPAGAAAAASTRGTGSTPHQAFRFPHSAFYPSATQRAFLSPQQHSQQLQQQSVLRANAMRQLIQLGFPEEEVQTIFSDINTNVERALIDLRDRTCHPGLDEIIRSFTGTSSAVGGLMPDENLGGDPSRTDMLSGYAAAAGAPMGMRPSFPRSGQHPNTMDQSLSKTSNLPNENLDLSIHVLQQRETQILQTIMQLQSKYQELNQRLNQIRSTNMPFASNPVLQELQLQAVQVASQIDAQHAQLKQIRSQAGVLKQLAAAAASAGPSSSAFTPPMTNTMWPGNVSAATAVPVFCPAGSGQSPQLADAAAAMDSQDSALKLGSGSLMWETGPWSGPGSRATGSFDACHSSTIDRRWSSAAFPNRPSYNALGDPRWSELGSESCHAVSNNVLLHSSETDFLSEENRPCRSWLLAHNIPPHVSVSILKMAVSTALSKRAIKPTGDKATSDSPANFELHPNMSARWVLIGLASANDAAVVQEYLESSGGEQNGSHYGSVKVISQADALLRLQDIQSLASRFKTFSNTDARSNAQQQQPSCVYPNADYTLASDPLNRPVGETN